MLPALHTFQSLSSLPKICSNFCHLSCFFSGSKNSKSFQPRSFRLLLFFQARPTHPKQWPQPKAPQPPKPCILNPNPSSKNDVMTSQPPGLESERTAVAYCAAGGDTQAATCPHQTVIVQAGRSFRPSSAESNFRGLGFRVSGVTRGTPSKAFVCNVQLKYVKPGM